MASQIVRCKDREEVLRLAAAGVPLLLDWGTEGAADWQNVQTDLYYFDYVEGLCGMPNWPPKDFGYLVDED